MFYLIWTKILFQHHFRRLFLICYPVLYVLHGGRWRNYNSLKMVWNWPKIEQFAPDTWTNYLAALKALLPIFQWLICLQQITTAWVDKYFFFLMGITCVRLFQTLKIFVLLVNKSYITLVVILLLVLQNWQSFTLNLIVSIVVPRKSQRQSLAFNGVTTEILRLITWA